jgi:hypothetical protein
MHVLIGLNGYYVCARFGYTSRIREEGHVYVC